MENNSLNSAMCAQEPWACRNPLLEGGGFVPGRGGTAAATGAGVAIGEALTDNKEQPNAGANLTDEEKAELGGAGSGTPGGWEPQDEENARNEGRKNLTVDDLTSTSSKGQETAGRSRIFERTGGSNAANKEFDALSPSNIKESPGGRVGKLTDGRTVIVRDRSTDGRPTLEIQSGKNKIKFRYGE